MKIFIGADHRGIELANYIYDYLKQNNYEVFISSLENDAEDDYPDFAFDVCNNVNKEKNNLGIVLCGNGIGISIAANKVKGIRCARVTNVEETYQAKNHNGANVIAFGGISKELTVEIVNTFINTSLPTEERHLRRIKKIDDYEVSNGY